MSRAPRITPNIKQMFRETQLILWWPQDKWSGPEERDCRYLLGLLPVNRPWHPWEPRYVQNFSFANHHQQTSSRMFWLETQVLTFSGQTRRGEFLIIIWWGFIKRKIGRSNSRKHFSVDEEEREEIGEVEVLYCCKKLGMKGSSFFRPEFVFTFNWEIVSQYDPVEMFGSPYKAAHCLPVRVECCENTLSLCNNISGLCQSCQLLSQDTGRARFVLLIQNSEI